MDAKKYTLSEAVFLLQNTEHLVKSPSKYGDDTESLNALERHCEILSSAIVNEPTVPNEVVAYFLNHCDRLTVTATNYVLQSQTSVKTKRRERKKVWLARQSKTRSILNAMLSWVKAIIAAKSGAIDPELLADLQKRERDLQEINAK